MGNISHNPTADARSAFEADILKELLSSLEEVSGGRIKVQKVESDFANLPGVDFSLDLDADGSPLRIAVEALRYGYPRDVQGAVWKLDEFKHTYDHAGFGDIILLVAAEALSPGARELLLKRGIGYFERNGNLNLKWRNWLINIERPDPPSAKKEATSLFTDSREAVVHALLVNKNNWLSGGELAAMSQTSPYTVSVVMQELERREWCESSGAGRTLRRRLHKPRELLAAWAEQWTKRKEHRSSWYCFSDNPKLLLTKLTDKIESSNPSFDWAFTGTAAANAYAPLLTSVDTAEIIVAPGKAEGLARDMRLKPADKGANVVFVERDGASLLFRDSIPELPSYFASPFIMYLDLLNGRGRNKELADHLLEKLEI
ncbi:type IV toxin-antitoxin system AbiEi family antitoxin [Burkholderia gladioli]|uniref:type IV toxin-antitoxin system AbiEi family antitoxin n=1 Tax=Burkholderia gladioli TaxID=28095 RepID=UPI001640101B|nr:type IV toxin-antitoxin system AbiEi family antitoxin [Burkholderia gladioli]MDN7805806.1 type IV toxin-antitoxin system AbiEi family antitoxin [Burkholderia gladioli]